MRTGGLPPGAGGSGAVPSPKPHEYKTAVPGKVKSCRPNLKQLLILVRGNPKDIPPGNSLQRYAREFWKSMRTPGIREFLRFALCRRSNAVPYAPPHPYRVLLWGLPEDAALQTTTWWGGGGSWDISRLQLLGRTCRDTLVVLVRCSPPPPPTTWWGGVSPS
jgi:hypothetical protein